MTSSSSTELTHSYSQFVMQIIIIDKATVQQKLRIASWSIEDKHLRTPMTQIMNTWEHPRPKLWTPENTHNIDYKHLRTPTT